LSRRCIVVRIVEEELVAVGVIDDQETVAPPALFERNAPGLEFCAQLIQRSGSGFGCWWLDVEGDEQQAFADLLRPGFGQDNRTALAVDLRHVGFAVLVESAMGW